MKSKRTLEILMQNILLNIEEGIHIINDKGKTIVYNSAMSEIEGLDPDQVIDNYILDIFPSLTKETSTLLKALLTGEVTKKHKQSYLNLKGKKVSSINTTFPIIDNDKIIGAIEIAKNITNVSHLSEQIIQLQQRLIKPNKNFNKIEKKPYYTFDNIIGSDKELIRAISFAKKACKTSSSVLIYGETGTGKELFAQSIHYGSNRRDNQFIAQNCAALPETLLEGILFGTTKGGFTDAIDRPGLFEQAHGGTLFLDEINSMSLSLQAKLLRVLQEGYVRRVGGLKEIPVNVRIIAATNEDPMKLIEDGKLRKDLYYRINVISISIPSLRKRQRDIPILIDYFIRHYNTKLNKDVWMMSEDLQEAFMEYSWPGNVRELQNFIEASMNMIIDEHVIKKEHMPPYVEDLIFKNNIISKNIEFDEIGSLNEYLDCLEKDIILKYLRKNKDNISKTSRDLGISRQNLQYKLKKYL